MQASWLCVSLIESLKILSLGRNNIKSLAGIVSLFIVVDVLAIAVI